MSKPTIMHTARTEELMPLRLMVISGNLMAMAMENPEKLESHERQQLIAAWNNAVARLRRAHLAETLPALLEA